MFDIYLLILILYENICWGFEFTHAIKIVSKIYTPAIYKLYTVAVFSKCSQKVWENFQVCCCLSAVANEFHEHKCCFESVYQMPIYKNKCTLNIGNVYMYSYIEESSKLVIYSLRLKQYWQELKILQMTLFIIILEI